MSKGTVRNVASPNYPVAPSQYNRQFMDQLVNVMRLNANTFANAINAPKVFGSYYSDAQQTNSGATAVNLMTVNNIIAEYGTSIRDPGSRVYVGETGLYNIQFSAQLDKTGGGAAAEIFIWLRLNGIDVPYTASKVVIQGANTELVAAWNFMIPMRSNDYFELAWASTDTTAIIAKVAAVTGPPAIPGIPSVILTVCAVSNIPASV